MHPTVITSTWDTMLMPHARLPSAGTKNMIFLHFNPVKIRGVLGPGTFVKTQDTLAIYSEVANF